MYAFLLMAVLVSMAGCHHGEKTSDKVDLDNMENQAKTIKDLMNDDIEKDKTVSQADDKIDGVGLYQEYDVATVDTFKGKKPYALYFSADWCSGCVALEKDLASSELPKSVAIFKADFDAESELKKEYGVTEKHTGVFFDATGEIVSVKIGVTKEEFITFFEG